MSALPSKAGSGRRVRCPVGAKSGPGSRGAHIDLDQELPCLAIGLTGNSPLMSKAGHVLTYINITVGATWYVK